MLKYLLDTNMVIYTMKNRPKPLLYTQTERNSILNILNLKMKTSDSPLNLPQEILKVI